MQLLRCQIGFCGASVLVGIFFICTFVVGRMTSAETKVTCPGVCETIKDIYGGGGGGGGGRGRRGREGGERRVEKVTVTVASTIEQNSLLMRQVSPTGDTYTGYLDDLLQEVSAMSDFRFQWSIVEENRKYVSKREMITEQLTSEKANIGILVLNSPTFGNDTPNLVFSRSVLTTSISLLHRTPPASSSTPRPGPLQLKDLLPAARNSRTRTKFAVLDESLAARIKAFNSSLYRQMWGHRAPSEVLLSPEEGLRRVRDDDLVLVVESTDADHLTSSGESCDVVTSSTQPAMHVTSYAFAALENSSLVLLEVDRVLADLGRSDFFGRLYAKWWGGDGGGNDGVIVCTPSSERGDADDSLDLERIFFTSPVKFFRSDPPPFADQEPTTTTRPEESLQVTAKASNRKRRRTTTTSGQVTMTSSSTILPTQNRINRGDLYPTQSPLRSAKHHSKATSTSSSSSSSPPPPARRQKVSDFKTRNEAVITVRPTTIDHVSEIYGIRRGSLSQDAPNDNRNNNRQRNNNNNNNKNLRSNSESRYHPTSRQTPRAMTSRGQFVDNYDWFFRTQEPRYPQEMDYDDESHRNDYDDNNNDDDDDDDTEQMAAYDESLDIEEDHVTVRTVLERSRSSSAVNRRDLQTKLSIALNIFASISAIRRFCIDS